MQTYWIIGHPLSFCLSEPVLNGAFKELGIEAKFETHDLDPEDLDETMEKVKSGELRGVILTRPFKTPSLDFSNENSKEVNEINATNLILNENGTLHAHNTDTIGACEALKSALTSLKDLNVLVLGAGGAARGAAYACKKEDAKVAIWNRTPEKAKEFAQRIGIEFVEDMRIWQGRPDIIINATALSNQASQSTLVPFPLWEKVKLAMDAVYGKTSLFLEEAKAAQVQHILPGDLWFLKQIIPIFELITKEKAPVTLMEQLTQESQTIQKRG